MVMWLFNNVTLLYQQWSMSTGKLFYNQGLPLIHLPDNFPAYQWLNVQPGDHHYTTLTYSGILSCIMPNDPGTTRVAACPVGDVIYLVIDDDPSIIPFVMFGHFLVGIGGQLFPSFTHVCASLLSHQYYLELIRLRQIKINELP